MKMTKSRLILSILAIAVLVISLTVTLLDAFIPLEIWIHPSLTFFFCLFLGFGLIAFGLGFAKKSAWYFFIGAILLGLALIYALSNYIEWWIILIIVVVVWAIMGVVSLLSAGNKTEDIALNASPDYKDYKQRMAEKEAAEKRAEENAVLPEIKSFKDEK